MKWSLRGESGKGEEGGEEEGRRRRGGRREGTREQEELSEINWFHLARALGTNWSSLLAKRVMACHSN